MGKQNLDFHHDSAPAHTFLRVKQFLISKQIITLHRPPYSTELAPSNFVLFPKLKKIIKGTRFGGVDGIKTNVTAQIKSTKKREFEKCFGAWSRRTMKCVEIHGK